MSTDVSQIAMKETSFNQLTSSSDVTAVDKEQEQKYACEEERWQQRPGVLWSEQLLCPAECQACSKAPPPRSCHHPSHPRAQHLSETGHCSSWKHKWFLLGTSEYLFRLWSCICLTIYGLFCVLLPLCKVRRSSSMDPQDCKRQGASLLRNTRPGQGDRGRPQNISKYQQ